MRSESAVLISAAGGRQGRGRDRPNARNALETLDDWVVPGPTHQVRLEIPDPGLQIAQLLGQRRRGGGGGRPRTKTKSLTTRLHRFSQSGQIAGLYSVTLKTTLKRALLLIIRS